LVSADQSTAATGHESSIARVYWLAAAIGCRSVTASHRSTPTRGQSTATSDWKKVKRPRRLLKNSVCRLLCQSSSFSLSWRSCSPRVLWSNSFTSGRTKKASGTIRISRHPESSRRNWEPVILLKHWRYNRPFPLPVSKEKRNTARGRSTQGASDVDPLGPASRRLLVFPPSDPGKPLSEWIPVESFDSVEECVRARASQIAGLVTQSTDVVDLRMLRSHCISLAEFKPSKEANVIVAATSVGSDPGGFSTWVLYGRVFNGGQTTARNVVVRYRARDGRGIIYAEGDISTAPQDISPLMFAEYRGQIVGSAGGSDRWVETEAKWSKD
jgi:hypothetical protein